MGSAVGVGSGGKGVALWGLIGLALLLLFLLLTSGGLGDTADVGTQTQPTQKAKTLDLYHYTDSQSMAGILSSQQILPSTDEVKYGAGQYFTDLPPTSLLTRPELATALYNNATLVYKTDYWVKVEVPSSEIFRVSDVVWQKLSVAIQPTVKKYGIYRRAGSHTFSIVNRLIDSGETSFR